MGFQRLVAGAANGHGGELRGAADAIDFGDSNAFAAYRHNIYILYTIYIYNIYNIDRYQTLAGFDEI